LAPLCQNDMASMTRRSAAALARRAATNRERATAKAAAVAADATAATCAAVEAPSTSQLRVCSRTPPSSTLSSRTSSPRPQAFVQESTGDQAAAEVAPPPVPPPLSIQTSSRPSTTAAVQAASLPPTLQPGTALPRQLALMQDSAGDHAAEVATLLPVPPPSYSVSSSKSPTIAAAQAASLSQVVQSLPAGPLAPVVALSTKQVLMLIVDVSEAAAMAASLGFGAITPPLSALSAPSGLGAVAPLGPRPRR
jgi:hypothetical protein